jgi:hypothetical protein
MVQPRREESSLTQNWKTAKVLGLPVIALVLADDAQINRLYVERDATKRMRLDRFRASILRQHTVQEFKDNNEAAWKVLAALRMYETRIREEARAGDDNA